jgi:hypothetical protein
MQLLDLLKRDGWGVSEMLEGRKGSWTLARKVLRVREDGTMEESTVLLLLAREKFPQGWEEGKVPYWADKNHLNETIENVELMTLKGVHEEKDEERRTKVPASKLGVPSNSAEYQRLYREQNRDKFRAANRKYQRNLRTAYAKAKKMEEPAEIPSTPDPVAEELAGQFGDLMDKLSSGEVK